MIFKVIPSCSIIRFKSWTKIFSWGVIIVRPWLSLESVCVPSWRDVLLTEYRDTDYHDYDDYYDKQTEKEVQQENAFSAEDIAMMKKKYEEKLKKDFPKRRDGQKTTLELIPELNTFVEPFFPKGPPPGSRPPPGGPGGPPPGPATHPPPGGDSRWEIPSLGCNTTDNTVFYLQVGPAAAGRGNQGESPLLRSICFYGINLIIISL